VRLASSAGTQTRAASNLQLPQALPERAQAQRVEADKTFGVALVVGGLALFECHQILVVE